MTKMSIKVHLLLWGTLALIVGIIALGICLTGTLFVIVLMIGLFLFICWIIFAFNLAVAMQSDVP